MPFNVFQDKIIAKQTPSSLGLTIMEKNEDAPKKETKFQRFNRFIALKGAPYEALLLAIALSLPGNIIFPWAFTAGLQEKWPFCDGCSAWLSSLFRGRGGRWP